SNLALLFLNSPFDEAAEFLLRDLVMGPTLGMSRIEFFVINGEALQMNDTIQIRPLTPELVLMKFHAKISNRVRRAAFNTIAFSVCVLLSRLPVSAKRTWLT